MRFTRQPQQNSRFWTAPSGFLLYFSVPGFIFPAFLPPLHRSLAFWGLAPPETVHLFLSALRLARALSLLLFPIFWGDFALNLGS